MIYLADSLRSHLLKKNLKENPQSLASKGINMPLYVLIISMNCFICFKFFKWNKCTFILINPSPLNRSSLFLFFYGIYRLRAKEEAHATCHTSPAALQNERNPTGSFIWPKRKAAVFWECLFQCTDGVDFT